MGGGERDNCLLTERSRPEKMARKTKPATSRASEVTMSRDEWALAFNSKVDELRPGMGRKYLAAVVATLWPKHQTDDPERVAAGWVVGRRQQY